MSRYLLDTNILSNLIKPMPSLPLIDWMADQPVDGLFLASLTIAEIHRGILEKSSGKKRKQLEAWFAGSEGPPALFASRILLFDAQAALIWAQLLSKATALGKPRSALDTVIAAIAIANDCIVVTDNEKHFTGMNVLNPLRPTSKP